MYWTLALLWALYATIYRKKKDNIEEVEELLWTFGLCFVLAPVFIGYAIYKIAIENKEAPEPVEE